MPEPNLKANFNYCDKDLDKILCQKYVCLVDVQPRHYIFKSG